MIERSDILAVLGLCLLSGGAWFIYPPAALIIAGALLLLASIGMARR